MGQNPGRPVSSSKALLACNCLQGPRGESLAVLYHSHRHFLERAECLFLVWPEGLHAVPFVEHDGFRSDFEIQPALVNDAEECFAMIQPIAAEHRAVGHIVQTVQLIQDEISELVAFCRHTDESDGPASGNHSHCDWKCDASGTPVIRRGLGNTVLDLSLLGI